MRPNAPRSIRPAAATSTTAAKMGLGRLRNNPVRNISTAAISATATRSAAGVLAPLASFTADCDIPPPTGYP